MLPPDRTKTSKMVRPLAGNPPGLRPNLVNVCRTNLQHCRMVWEDYFTSGTKPGSRKVGALTIELISRVLNSKPSKLIVLVIARFVGKVQGLESGLETGVTGASPPTVTSMGSSFYLGGKSQGRNP